MASTIDVSARDVLLGEKKGEISKIGHSSSFESLRAPPSTARLTRPDQGRYGRPRRGPGLRELAQEHTGPGTEHTTGARAAAGTDIAPFNAKLPAAAATLQQPLSVNFQQQQGAYMMDAGSRNASVDSVLRNASIDSDLAYDGIEEVRLQT